jgi:hypothetical protein
MPYGYDVHDARRIQDGVDDPVIADPNAPEVLLSS